MQDPARAIAWRGYVGLSLGWLIIFGVALLLTRRPSAQSIEILPPPTPLPTLTPAPSPTPPPLRVDVIGAVHAPGVYVLPPGSIVADAIAAAGGATSEAALDWVNKAVPLQDGMQINIPRAEASGAPLLANPIVPAAAPGPTTNTTGQTAANPAPHININTATPEELDTLPGVGPSTAQLIIQGRPYSTIEDLLRVKGIGPATFEKLQDHITVQ